MSGQQPFNVGDVVLAGFKICSDRWKPLLKVTAMTVLPAAIFGSLLVATYMPKVLLDALANTRDPEVTDAALRAVPPSEWVNLGVAALVYVFVSSIANIWALGGCALISLSHHDQTQLSHGDALRASFSKLPSLVWLMLISGLLTLIGLLLCILPGLWLAVSWVVAPIVLLRAGVKGGKALGRSFRMVRPRFWLVFVVVALEVACLLVFQTLIGGLPGLLLPGSADANSFAVFFALSLGSALAGLFGVALHAAIATELYFALEAAESPAPVSSPENLLPLTPPPPPPPPQTP